MSQASIPTRQLIIIDSHVNNWQSLANGVSADNLVLILDSSSDGLTQISDYLASLSANGGAENRVPLQSIHIISHGSAGSLLLGSSTLTVSNLSLYSRQLATLGDVLIENGDILLYGCNVAADPAGLAFINQFAGLTNADVAASNNLTGSAALGGDWLLEAATGTIESSLALSTPALNTYPDILADIQAGDDYPADNSTSANISIGGSAAGAHETPADVDWFKVTLNAGAGYQIDLEGSPTSQGTLSDPTIVGVYDSVGALLTGTTDDDSGVGYNARVLFNSATTGTYYIATGAYGDNVGSYRLSVASLGEDDFSGNTSTAGNISAGGSMAGVLEVSNDVDWFLISLVAGQHYRIDLVGASSSERLSLTDPSITGIYDSTGTLLAGTSDNDSGVGSNAMVLFTPTASGTYYLAAGGNTGRIGTYQLSVAETTGDDYPADNSTSANVTVDGSAVGVVEVPADVDWFKVTLIAGMGYQIDLEGLPTSQGTLPDPNIMGVYDSAGVLLSGTTDDDSGDGNNARVLFGSAITGTYYIAAGAFLDNAGSYRLSVATLAVNHSPEGTDKTVTLLEDDIYTFAAADFGFSDPNDSPANILQAVKITTLPGAGSLMLNSAAVVVGQSVTVADIHAGHLKFTPAANASGTNYAGFTFQVQDNGGIAAGGVDLDASPNTLSINVTAVNDKPDLSTPTAINYIETIFDDTFATVTGALAASDSDGTSVTYGIAGGTGQINGTISQSSPYGVLTVNKTTGAYNFVPNDAAIEALSLAVSAHFTVTASDGLLSDSEILAINIAQQGRTASTGTESNGNDRLIGTSGDDRLDGLAGADTMTGRSGNDTYVVDNPRDRVIENTRGGNDTVISLISYALNFNVENLTLSGTNAINGTGNTLNNVLTGNTGANTLNGGTGADSLIGGLGNDVYIVDNNEDVVTETSTLADEIDTVKSSKTYTLGANLENLILTGSAAINGTGNALDNILTGNKGANVLDGGTGDDLLEGGIGNDTLTGGAGHDSFQLKNTSQDTITDFSILDDTIQLENSVFTQLTATGVLNTGNFKIGAAADTNDYVIYNSGTGALYYDANGSDAGGAIQIALLGVHLDLTHADFFVI